MLYLLVIYNPGEKIIRVGSLGLIRFHAGCYVYIGSGGRNVYKRVSRHFHRDKRLHWHIDYLTKMIPPMEAYLVKDKISEEELSMVMARKYRYIKGFGSSDKRSISHLFYIGPICDIDTLIKYLNSNGIKEILKFSFKSL